MRYDFSHCRETWRAPKYHSSCTFYRNHEYTIQVLDALKKGLGL